MSGTHRPGHGLSIRLVQCFSFVFFPQTAKHWGSNLGHGEWESVTPIPGPVFCLCFLSPSLSGQMPDAVTLAPGSCLPVSPSLCGQMPDAVTPAWGRVSRTALNRKNEGPGQNQLNLFLLTQCSSQQEPLATMFRNGERACRRFCC